MLYGMGDDDYDRAAERRQIEEDERYEARRRADRVADHTPSPLESRNGAARGKEPSGFQAPRITSAMETLAWTVLNGPDHDRRDACKVLAELVLEAGECCG